MSLAKIVSIGNFNKELRNRKNPQQWEMKCADKVRYLKVINNHDNNGCKYKNIHKLCVR